MPEIRITIGGRDFDVSCQDGEEHYLMAAARMLDNEASVVIGQIGRMPETRLLLMAGLMLADKAAGLEDQLRLAEDRAATAERALERARANPERIEVPVIPDIVTDTFAELAARAEAVAERAEERLAS